MVILERNVQSHAIFSRPLQAAHARECKECLGTQCQGLNKRRRRGRPVGWRPGVQGLVPCRSSRLSFQADRGLVVPSAVTTAVRTTPISGEGMFTPRLMASIAHVASPVPRFVSLEVVEALGAALRHGSSITVMRIKPVVDMSVEAVRAMKPRACAQKNPANKPIRSVVAVGRAVIGGIVEVSVRTHGSRPDIYANCNLSWRNRCRA